MCACECGHVYDCVCVCACACMCMSDFVCVCACKQMSGRIKMTVCYIHKAFHLYLSLRALRVTMGCSHETPGPFCSLFVL